MKYKPNFAEAVERMRRLWAMEEPLDRVPCVVNLPAPPRPADAKPRADGSFFGQPEAYLQQQEETLRRRAEVADEWMPQVRLQFGHALISALLGSPARVEAETTWSVPFLDDWSQIDDLRLDFDCDWGRRFRRELEIMLDWARGKCAVADYEVEGISDTMAALRGTERLCFDFHDAPDEVRRFARKVTDLLIEWGRWQNEHVAAPQDLLGGLVLDWALWMPAGSIGMAEDGTVLWSPAQYREFLKDEDRRLTAAFTRVLVEVHAEGNHQIPEFGDVDGFSMLTIQNPLRMKPEHRESVRALLGRKAFYIGCRPDEIDDLLAFTGTRGVFLVTSAKSPAEAASLLADLERLTWKHAGR